MDNLTIWSLIILANIYILTATVLGIAYDQTGNKEYRRSQWMDRIFAIASLAMAVIIKLRG